RARRRPSTNRDRPGTRERTSRVLPVYATVIIAAAASGVVAAVAFAVWMANRKRIAVETIGRAEEQALRLVKDAERDAETRKKEALLDAKEKAHEILMEAERQARQDRQQAAALEQTLNRRDAVAAERQATLERLERELTGRDRDLRELQKSAAAAAERCGEIVAQHKH